MKKAKIIKLSLLIAIAATVLACGNNSVQSDYSSCIDQFGNVREDWNCTNNTPGFRIYYSPSPFYYGSHVYGGGYVSHSVTHVYVHKTINHTYTPRISNPTPQPIKSTVPKSIITLHRRK
jgi:hypothetical protein